MIKELIFSGKKYYEGNMPCYVGKTFKSPTSPIDKWKTNTDSFYYVEPAHESLIPSGPILGQVADQDNVIFLMGGVVDQYYLVKLTDLIQNGGVSSSLLTHVYHAFILARKELSMANNVLKILFDKDRYIRATKGNSQLVAIGAKTAIEVSEPNNAHENIEQHNPLLVYVTSYDNNYYQIVDFNGYPFYSTHTWGGETYKDDNWLKNDATYTVRKEEVLQIGGVLRRLYTKLCGAFRKQVVVC